MNHNSVTFKKNDKRRVHAKCATEGCKWKIHEFKVAEECTFRVSQFLNEYSNGYDEEFGVKTIKSKWLSEKYLYQFMFDPKEA